MKVNLKGSITSASQASPVLPEVRANVSAAIPQERPGAFAMVIDVPIRVVGLGLALIGSAFFVVALPFALTSGSTGDAWDVLVIEPFEFTFTRPLGKFDEWKSP